MVRYFVVFSLLAMFAISGNAQGLSNEGTEFWLGFMPNGDSSNSRASAELILASHSNAKVTIEQGDTTYRVTLRAGVTTELQLRASALTLWEESPIANAVHVRSTSPISVYGGANGSCVACIGNSIDGYLGLPLAVLGTEYYTMNYPDDKGSGEFLVVAPYDCNVTITTVASTKGGKLPNQQFSVALKRGQTYLVQSPGNDPGANDLTGSHITSDKPIAVISGHQYTSVPSGRNSWGDLMEMMPAVNRWGTEYFDLPMSGRTQAGDLLRILSADYNNEITVDTTHITLQAGDYYDIPTRVTPAVVRSTNGKKFMLAQYSYSQGYDGDPQPADPFMTLCPPIEQFEKQMLVSIPSSSPYSTLTNFLTVISLADSLSKITINGSPIKSYPLAGQAILLGVDPPLVAYRVNLTRSHTAYSIKSPVPIGVMQYGVAPYTGYGWPSGMAQHMQSADTMPPALQVLDSVHGIYLLRFTESRLVKDGYPFDDSRIACVSLVTDSGDARSTTTSQNFGFAPDPNFVVGDSVMTATLAVSDLSKAANAVLYAVDRAGNEAVYQLQYSPPNISHSPDSLDFGTVEISTTSCRTITIENNSTSELDIDSLFFSSDVKGGKFLSAFIAPSIVLPHTRASVSICYTPSDLGIRSIDTMVLVTSGGTFPFALSGIGGTPLIFVSNLYFGPVRVGDTVCRPLTVQNLGSIPLDIRRDNFPSDSIFSFPDTAGLMSEIPPGGSSILEVCFHPRSMIPYSRAIAFTTRNPSPYEHSIRDTALISGSGTIFDAVQEISPPLAIEAVPNPSNGIVTLRYSLASTEFVSAKIYDIAGRELFRVVENEMQYAGEHNLSFNLSSLSSSVYICQLSWSDPEGNIAIKRIRITKE